MQNPTQGNRHTLSASPIPIRRASGSPNPINSLPFSDSLYHSRPRPAHRVSNEDLFYDSTLFDAERAALFGGAQEKRVAPSTQNDGVDPSRSLEAVTNENPAGDGLSLGFQGLGQPGSLPGPNNLSNYQITSIDRPSTSQEVESGQTSNRQADIWPQFDINLTDQRGCGDRQKSLVSPVDTILQAENDTSR